MSPKQTGARPELRQPLEIAGELVHRWQLPLTSAQSPRADPGRCAQGEASGPLRELSASDLRSLISSGRPSSPSGERCSRVGVAGGAVGIQTGHAHRLGEGQSGAVPAGAHRHHDNLHRDDASNLGLTSFDRLLEAGG